MNTNKIKVKRKLIKRNARMTAGNIRNIQPFTQTPSDNDTGKDNSDRITAHDLFSHYTAEIIKEDKIFAR